MDRASIRAKVFDLVVETLEVEEGSVTEAARFDLLVLERGDELEDEFGLTLDDGSLGEIATVGDAIDAIENAQ
jgi:acyl carrier protein